MATAATLEEMVGIEAALPFYALSVVVGVQRIDERDHFVSQVISGWVLGYVVGKTVAGRRRLEVAGFSVEPYVDPGSGLVGFGLSKEF